MLKKELRNLYLDKRLEIAETKWKDLSLRICDQFNSLNLPSANWLLSYCSNTRKKEFDVLDCERIIKEKMQQLSICQPRINAGDYSMEAVLCDINTTFKENIYRIPEPVDGKIINPLLLDIVFVPLVAFDANGYRVGYGKGYFDRFLHRCKPGIIKIGFSFFEASGAIDDINEFDVPLNFCITPQRIYEF